jgi:hypothetical protein
MPFADADNKFIRKISLLDSAGGRQAGFQVLTSETLASNADSSSDGAIGVTPSGRIASYNAASSAWAPGACITSGVITIADANMSGTATLAAAPPATALFIASVKTATGSPSTIPAVRLSLSGTTLTATLSAAPGSSNSFDVAYQIL